MASVASSPQREGSLGPSGEHRLLSRAIDVLGVGAFLLLWSAAAVDIGRSASPLEWVAFACLAFPAGHLLADLLSGLLHWFADEFFEEDTPLLGPTLIYGFRDHHRNPRDILGHRLLEVSGYNALAMLPVLVALLSWPGGGALARSLQAVLLATTLSIAATNQLHRWAHADRVPYVVAWLQQHHVILSPEHHARHHLRGDRAYCVTAGWWNPTLDTLGVLPAVSQRIHRSPRHPGG